MTTTTSTRASTAPATPVNVGDPVQTATFTTMLAILNDLVSHTHVFFDDYSTACNCNCNCACSRGIL